MQTANKALFKDRKISKAKLEKIRRENARFEKRTPYNFCNRWCERCVQERRDRCTVYKDDFERTLKHLADGKDPSDWNLVLDDVRKNFEKTMGLIQKWAKEENIDLSQGDDNEYQEQQREERELLKHPLHKLMIRYSNEANAFLREYFCGEDDIEKDLFGEYETINWYHTLLLPKIHRFLCDLYVREKDDYDFGLCDGLAQMNIINKGISESMEALEKISSIKISQRYKISILSGMLNQILEQIKEIASEFGLE